MSNWSKRSNEPDGSQAASFVTRRRFLEHVGLGTLALAWGVSAIAGPSFSKTAAKTARAGLPETSLLEQSSFAYISPLLANGEESTCHGEVWFGWIDDSVIVTVATDRWKAKALARGLDQARIWVGDHGRWKGMLGSRNEKFREAPNFVARAEKVEDPAMIERLLEVYGRKYPHEIATWRDKMRTGNADGSRIMIRYRPISDSTAGAQPGRGQDVRPETRSKLPPKPESRSELDRSA